MLPRHGGFRLIYPYLFETQYGDGTLQKYADDIGVEYGTLLMYRRVAEIYKKCDRSQDVYWTVHNVLRAQPDRGDLLQSRDKWTVSEARELVKARNAPAT